MATVPQWWSYGDMEAMLQKHLEQYKCTSGWYRGIKRKAIIKWVGLMREKRAGA